MSTLQAIAEHLCLKLWVHLESCSLNVPPHVLLLLPLLLPADHPPPRAAVVRAKDREAACRGGQAEARGRTERGRSPKGGHMHASMSTIMLCAAGADNLLHAFQICVRGASPCLCFVNACTAHNTRALLALRVPSPALLAPSNPYAHMECPLPCLPCPRSAPPAFPVLPTISTPNLACAAHDRHPQPCPHRCGQRPKCAWPRWRCLS